MPLRSKKKKFRSLWSFLCSSVQVVGLLLSKKTPKNLLIAFPRLDTIAGKYVDKFTDPIVDSTTIGENYIIFEHGRGGQHLTPRYHSNKIIWIDSLAIISYVVSRVRIKSFKNNNQDILKSLFACIDSFMNNQWYSRDVFEKSIYEYLIYGKMYEFIFRRLKIMNLFAVTRPVVEFTAAKKNRIRTFELQHGITYGETSTYSGYRDELMMPDFFLAFGDNKPKEVYGIAVERIVNIGWAFPNLLRNAECPIKPNSSDVLVISDPEVTDAMIAAVSSLAKSFPNSVFYLRPHPHEHYTEEQISAISKVSNMRIQDNKINIALILQSFTYVLGESSSVLYEALANGNMVGKLFMKGLSPKYLEKEDTKAFCEIHNEQDFRAFIEGNWHPEVKKSIYSPFNAERLNSLLQR